MSNQRSGSNDMQISFVRLEYKLPNRLNHSVQNLWNARAHNVWKRNTAHRPFHGLYRTIKKVEHYGYDSQPY